MGSTGIGPSTHYMGPAPEPSRRISLVSGDSPGDANLADANVVDPATLTPGISGPLGGAQTFSSPAPADPEAAAQVATLGQRVGELVQALGTQRQDFERQMREQQLRYEAMFASALASQAPNISAPDNSFDPEEPVKAGQMIGVLNQWNAINQAQMIRALSQITPQEEAAVFASHPYLQNVPEPKKSELLKEAVLIQRSAVQAAAATDGRTPQGDGHAPSQSPRVTRPAARVVPMPEYQAQNTGGVDEPIPVNNLGAAQAEYEAAKRIPDKRERFAAMKAAMQKAAAARGISPEQLAKSSWVQ